MDGYRYATGLIFVDIEDIQEMYKAFAVRITDAGNVEVLVDNDGIGWLDINDAEQLPGPNH